MKIDMSKVLVSFKGEPLVDGPEPILLRDILVNALNAPDNKTNPDGKEKQRRYHLAQKIWGALEPIDLSVDDLSLLKTLVANVYPSPMIVGQVLDILDPQLVN